MKHIEPCARLTSHILQLRDVSLDEDCSVLSIFFGNRRNGVLSLLVVNIAHRHTLQRQETCRNYPSCRSPDWELHSELLFLFGFCPSPYTLEAIKHKKAKKTPWPESASKLYRPSDRRLSAKLVPTFGDTWVRRGQRDGSPRPYSRLCRSTPLLFLPSSSSTPLQTHY
jgi:hypothetical protein